MLLREAENNDRARLYNPINRFHIGALAAAPLGSPSLF